MEASTIHPEEAKEQSAGDGLAVGRQQAIRRQPVFRVLLHQRSRRGRLHEFVVAQLLNRPPSTHSDIQSLLAKDVRLTPKKIWASRHVMAFGPEANLSVAVRLLRAYNLPGCARHLEAWLSREWRGTFQQRTPLAKASQRKPLERKMRQLKLKELFKPANVQPAQERRGLLDAAPNSGQERKRKNWFGEHHLVRESPAMHTYESVFGRRSYLSDVRVHAIGRVIL